MTGKRGTVFPNPPCQIQIITDSDIRSVPCFICLFRQLFFQSAAFPAVHDPAVKTKRPSRLHFPVQEIRDIGNPFLLHLKQRNSRPLQLFFRLYEIPAVGPKPCHVLSDYQRPARSGETGKVFPCLKITVHVLGTVEIRSRNDIIIHPFRFHLPTQSLKPVLYDSHYPQLPLLDINLPCLYGTVSKHH